MRSSGSTAMAFPERPAGARHLAVQERRWLSRFRSPQVDGFSSALIGAIGKLKSYFARTCQATQHYAHVAGKGGECNRSARRKIIA
jgi:hypothetical protein